MSRFAMSKVLHVFFIFAFVAAMISPACAFVSGKTGSLEICAADGSVKTVSVLPRYDLSAFLDSKDRARDKNPAPTHNKSADQCGFCFAQSHITKAILSSPALAMPMGMDAVSHSDAGNVTYYSHSAAQFQPRAPPLSFA